MKPDKNPKVESRLDSLFWIQNDKEEFILNIEPQGYYESSLPARMLRYRSDIWEIKKDYIINNKLIGLYPMLPLMKVEPGETDEGIIERTVKVIETIEDEALKGM